MKFLRITAVLNLMLITGCAQIGLAAPQSFRDRLVYSIGLNESTRRGCIDLLKAGTMTRESGMKCAEATNAAEASIALAVAADKAGEAAKASAELAKANAASKSVATNEAAK